MIRWIISPTNGGDGRRDLGEVRVHRRSVGEGQHQAGSDPAPGADRAEEIGPLAAGVARRPRPGAAPRPEAGERALLANPRVRHGPRTDGGTMAHSWNQISIGLPRTCSGIAAATAAPKP